MALSRIAPEEEERIFAWADESTASGLVGSHVEVSRIRQAAVSSDHVL